MKPDTTLLNGDYVVPIKEALDPERKKKETFEIGINALDESMAGRDEEVGGFKEGDLMVISGRSGEGKTLMALNFLKNFIDNGYPAMLFTYEVIVDNIYDDLMEMGMEEDPMIYTPKKNISGDIKWIDKKIDECLEKYSAKIIIIDHLDFLTSDCKNDDYRRNEITNIVTHLKTSAIEKNIVIVLLAHVVKTADRTLGNESLADSRAIANLSDYILFVAREKDDNGIAIGNTGRAKLSKNRYTGKQISFEFSVYNKVIHEYDPRDLFQK